MWMPLKRASIKETMGVASPATREDSQEAQQNDARPLSVVGSFCPLQDHPFILDGEIPNPAEPYCCRVPSL